MGNIRGSNLSHSPTGSPQHKESRVASPAQSTASSLGGTSIAMREFLRDRGQILLPDVSLISELSCEPDSVGLQQPYSPERLSSRLLLSSNRSPADERPDSTYQGIGSMALHLASEDARAAASMSLHLASQDARELASVSVSPVSRQPSPVSRVRSTPVAANTAWGSPQPLDTLRAHQSVSRSESQLSWQRQLDTLQRQMSQLDASMSANSHPSSMSVPACNPLKQPAAAYQSKVDPIRKPESSEDTAMRGNPRQDAASCEWSGRAHLDDMAELNAGTPKGRLLRYQRLVNKLQKERSQDAHKIGELVREKEAAEGKLRVFREAADQVPQLRRDVQSLTQTLQRSEDIRRKQKETIAELRQGKPRTK